MPDLTQYIQPVLTLLVGAVIGGYAVFIWKRVVLPADMDQAVSIAMSAITQVQQIYGDNDKTNTQKAAESLDIAGRAMADAGVPVNAATLALIIRIAYHAMKPQVKSIPSSNPY